jgi:hypothetical protein
MLSRERLERCVDKFVLAHGARAQEHTWRGLGTWGEAYVRSRIASAVYGRAVCSRVVCAWCVGRGAEGSGSGERWVRGLLGGPPR